MEPNLQFAKRLIETLLAGYDNGTEGMKSIHSNKYADHLDISLELGLQAFSLCITEVYPHCKDSDIDEVQVSIEWLIKAVENYIITGKDIGIDLDFKDYVSLIIKDLILIDDSCRGKNIDFKLKKELANYYHKRDEEKLIKLISDPRINNDCRKLLVQALDYLKRFDYVKAEELVNQVIRQLN